MSARDDRAEAMREACEIAPAWRVELWAEQIRVAWVDWARTQPNPKPSWLVPWAELDAQSKDADRAIARRLLALYALPLPACATGDDAAHGEMVKRCPTCDLDDPALHPCDAGGCAHPCADDYHREAAVKTCAEPGCASLGLTKARTWRCAIHHPEHPTPAPSRPADDGERTALSLLADARKCVALVNVNGYYDVWLARCDRVLATAKRPADDAVARAREAFTEAGRRYCEAVNDDALVFQRVERWHEWNRAYAALLAAEHAAKGGGEDRPMVTGGGLIKFVRDGGAASGPAAVPTHYATLTPSTPA